MPDRFYRDEDQPGTPRRKDEPAIAQNIGPLPAWGWAVVAVGAIFLWRRIAGGTAASSSATPNATPFYPAGAGDVFVVPIPSSGTPTPAPTPAPAPAPAPQYGPIYPNGAPGKADKPCPTGYMTVQGPSGWTCVTPAQYDILNAYLGYRKVAPIPGSK